MTVPTTDLHQRVFQEHGQSVGTFKQQHLPLLQTHLLNWTRNLNVIEILLYTWEYLNRYWSMNTKIL